MGGRGGAGRSSGGDGGQRLAEVIQFPLRPRTTGQQGQPGQVIPISGNVESAIRRAYNTLRGPDSSYVSLTRLRDRLAGFDRGQVDDALRRLSRQPGVSLIPQSNQKVLTAKDRAAMINIGNQDKLLISFT